LEYETPFRQIVRPVEPKSRLPVIGSVLSALLLIVGCSTTTFMVSKDCKTYYLGSSDERFHTMLCASGDFEKVLIAAKFPQTTREAFQNAQCVERSRQKIHTLYSALTPEQQENLKSAFRERGYCINAKPTSNFKMYPLSPNIDFCPQNEEY
jgi:hypothetical protein